jgi:hypothetical protein
MRQSFDTTVPRERRLRRRAQAAIITFVGCVSLLLVPKSARAGESDASSDRVLCADSYRNAQVQRKNGALKRARESLLVCVSDRCPAVLQPDCTRWLTEVEAALPSVSFAAKDADGKDVTAVRVSIDGQPLTDTLDGKAISIDPGSHTVRFEHAGEVPIEQAIVIREGEKARVVNVSWAKSRPEAGSDGATSSPKKKAGIPAGTWVFGGIGVGAVATFGVLALDAMQRRSDLSKQCFGSCREEQVDSIKTQLTVADVALGAGIVSLGVSAVLLLSSGALSSEPSRASTPRARSVPVVSFGAAPLRNGGAATIAATF